MKNVTTINPSSSANLLGPIHIWALGVGIVLVGEFMGWNFMVARGGSIGAIIAVWLIAIMYTLIVMMTIEMASVLPIPGGQYAMAKSILGPLAAFNVGLMLVLEYAMLEAADVVVIGDLLTTIFPQVHKIPVVMLTLLFLTLMNYRGAYTTLSFNFVITAIAFISIIILLFSTNFYDSNMSIINIKNNCNILPFGTLGIFAAMQFAIWFFLGIEGTAMAASECQCVNRALTIGTIIGLMTLLISGTITWFVCSGLINANELGASVYPLYDAAVATGKPYVKIILFVGTLLSCLASANGCINDASRAWSALSFDTMMPTMFSINHPRFGTPYRSILFLFPISLIFAFTGILDQIITFSILSALMIYIMTAVMMYRFRKLYPLGTIKRGFITPMNPIPSIITIILAFITIFGMSISYWINIIASILFYTFASVWFILFRHKHMNQISFFSVEINNWGLPHI